MGKFFQILGGIIFGQRGRRLSRIILEVFLALATVCAIYLIKNPDQFIRLPNQDLFWDGSAKSTFSLDGQSQTGSDTKSAGSGQKSTTKIGTISGSTGGQSGSTSEGASAQESVSAFVAFYADNQSDSDPEDALHLSVINQILATGANPIFHAGDLMEDGTEDSLNRFNNIAGGLVASRSFYGALGNNDRNGGDTTTPSPLYLANFSFPGNERWYSVNAGNLHLIVLDSAFAASDPSQLSWLASDLQSAASQGRITGVMYHHPTFTSSIESYLINYGADFVISGHVHTYSKFLSNGMYRFTLSGGAGLGYSTLRVYSSYAEFRAYNSAGSLVETTTILNR